MSQLSLLLDTNICSIFAELDKFDLLLTVLSRYSLHVSPTVYNELLIGLNRGHTHLQHALDHIGENKQIHVVSLNPEETDSLKTLPTWLGSGEAECIVICRNQDWIFASFDRKAVNYCRQNNVTVLTLNSILAALWMGQVVTKDEVKLIITEIEASGRTIKSSAEILKE